MSRQVDAAAFPGAVHVQPAVHRPRRRGGRVAARVETAPAGRGSWIDVPRDPRPADPGPAEQRVPGEALRQERQRTPLVDRRQQRRSPSRLRRFRGCPADMTRPGSGSRVRAVIDRSPPGRSSAAGRPRRWRSGWPPPGEPPATGPPRPPRTPGGVPAGRSVHSPAGERIVAAPPTRVVSPAVTAANALYGSCRITGRTPGGCPDPKGCRRGSGEPVRKH